MYDFGSGTSEFVQTKRKAEERGQLIGPQQERQRYLESVSRQSDEFRKGHNISTIMHEAAHQLSFNSGLMSRFWPTVHFGSPRGLACYCEATNQGSWLGIGEPNPERIAALGKALNAKAGLLPLTTMIPGDKWLSPKGEETTVLQAYAQGWALFRWLMEEKPAKLREYMEVC